MAIRYSGDVEVRIEHGNAYFDKRGGVVFEKGGAGFYYATIRAPKVRKAAILSYREAGLNQGLMRKPVSSETYDRVAEAMILWVEKHIGKLPIEYEGPRVLVRRVFQSPCPVRIHPGSRRDQ